MIKRIQLLVLTIAALATAVGIALVSAAFAVYALLTPMLGQAGAAAAVSAIAAVIVVVAALLMRMEAGDRGHRGREPEPGLADKLFQIARDRPILAGGAALAAGLLALKNPQAAAGLVSAFLAGKAADRSDHRRR